MCGNDKVLLRVWTPITETVGRDPVTDTGDDVS